MRGIDCKKEDDCLFSRKVITTILSATLLLTAVPAGAAEVKQQPTVNQLKLEKTLARKSTTKSKLVQKVKQSRSRASLLRQGFRLNPITNQFAVQTGYWGQVKYTFDPNTGIFTLLPNDPGEMLSDRDQYNGSYHPDYGRDQQLNKALLVATQININGALKTPEDSYNLFSYEAPKDDSNDDNVGLSNLQKINGLDNLDTSQVTNMSFMFYGDSALTDLDVSHFNTRNVTSMRDMFAGMWNLPQINVASLNIKQSDGDLYQMFTGDVSLQKIDGMNKWQAGDDDANLTQMFQYDRKLRQVDLGGFNGIRHYDGLFDDTVGSAPVQSITSLQQLILGKQTDFIPGNNENPQIPEPQVGNEFNFNGQFLRVAKPTWFNLNNGQSINAARLGQGSHPGNWIWNGRGSEPTPPIGPDGIKKRSKVYAIHAINMYHNSNLTGKIRHYKKVKRLKRPRFYVKKIVKTKHGTPRYYVKQLNKRRYGWISGNKKFVVNNYYQKRTKTVRFKIINPKGLNIYKRLTLRHKVKHLKYKKIIKARQVKKDGLQTRFYLKRGQYVSARKNFVLYQ